MPAQRKYPAEPTERGAPALCNCPDNPGGRVEEAARLRAGHMDGAAARLMQGPGLP
jgi:hypothetical protein